MREGALLAGDTDASAMHNHFMSWRDTVLTTVNSLRRVFVLLVGVGVLVEQIGLVAVPVGMHRPIGVGVGVLMTDVVVVVRGVRMRMRHPAVTVLMFVRVLVGVLLCQRRLLGRTRATPAVTPSNDGSR